MEDCKEILEKLKDIEIKNNPMPFNMLYIAYQDAYGKERLHSKLLAGLLNPNENHKLGDAPLKHFLHRIDVVADSLQNVKVETEKNVNGRFIDVFVSWKDDNNENHAIIIENKLHGAGDQGNQLNDYYDGTKDEYSIEKIVYIPFDKTYKSFENTDIKECVKEKCINFDAKDIVAWLDFMITENVVFQQETAMLEQYKEFFECLINTKYTLMQAQEIIGNLSIDEINKLEKLAAIMRKVEWSEAIFAQKYGNLLTNIQKEVNQLQLKYKQNADYRNYVQLYFDNWEDTYWYEIWLYEDGFYVYKYDSKEYSDETYFAYNEDNKLVEYLIPLLRELSNRE